VSHLSKIILGEKFNSFIFCLRDKDLALEKKIRGIMNQFQTFTNFTKIYSIICYILNKFKI